MTRVLALLVVASMGLAQDTEPAAPVDAAPDHGALLTDAVLHFNIDKRACALEAQEFGYMTATRFFAKFIDADREEKAALIKSRDLFGFWQGLLRVVGSFGDCPRCLAVCPVGNDYHAHLADDQKTIFLDRLRAYAAEQGSV